jgi:hypothetical protein
LRSTRVSTQWLFSRAFSPIIVSISRVADLAPPLHPGGPLPNHSLYRFTLERLYEAQNGKAAKACARRLFVGGKFG